MRNYEKINSDSRPLSQKVVKNTMYNFLGVLCISVASLILTPLIINALGLEQFGIWVTIHVFITYLGFFDFSMSSPIIKYVAEYLEKGDKKKLNELFNTSLVFYVLIGSAVILGRASKASTRKFKRVLFCSSVNV